MNDNELIKKACSVSVITVTYNAEPFLQKTIDSIRRQTYADIEYIVVDGGSTDGTVEIINKNQDIIDGWVSEADSGIYDAMNKGVKLASGDYVIFMNAGDLFYDPCAIEKCMECAGNSDVVYGDHWVIGSRRNDGHHRAKEPSDLLFGMICSHQSMFFKRSTLLKYQFSLSHGTAGDYDCIARLYNAGASFIYCENNIVSFYAAGGVSDVHRVQSIKHTYRSARDNFNLKFTHKFVYVKSFVSAYLLCFIRL